MVARGSNSLDGDGNGNGGSSNNTATNPTTKPAKQHKALAPKSRSTGPSQDQIRINKQEQVQLKEHKVSQAMKSKAFGAMESKEFQATQAHRLKTPTQPILKPKQKQPSVASMVSAATSREKIKNGKVVHVRVSPGCLSGVITKQ